MNEPQAPLDWMRILEIDRTSPIPAYVQISEGIRRLLLAGQVPPGSRLPATTELSRHFGVSLMTVRDAFALLTREGLIESHRGRGTFTRRPRVEKTLTEMRGFTEEMLLRGKTPETQVLSFRSTRPGFAVRDLFQLEEGEQVYEIRRLRLADGVRLALEEVYLPAAQFPGLERHIASGQSLYGALRQVYSLKLSGSVDEISSVLPTREQRRLLEIDHPVGLLQIRRTSYSSSNRAVELAVTLYRGDLYTATVHPVRVPDSLETIRGIHNRLSE